MRRTSLLLILVFACHTPTPVKTTPTELITLADQAQVSSPPTAAALATARGDLLALPADAPLPLDPAIAKGVLPNGLTYYVLPHKQYEKRALVWLAVNAGSVQEADDQRGLAHFVEHMAFNGTKRFPKQEIIALMRSWGMEFGADVNAHTNFDETVYKLRVPTDKPEYVATALDILRDWAGDISFDPKEVEAERGVVNEERRVGAGAEMRIVQETIGLLLGPGYGNRLPIGTEATILKAPRERLVDFYRDWYRPDLMAVFVFGDVTPEAVVPLLTARFSDLKPPTNPKPRPVIEPPAAGQIKVQLRTEAELRATLVSISSVRPHGAEMTRADLAKWLAALVGVSALGERFRDVAKDPQSPLLAAFPDMDSAGRTADAFGVVGIAKPNREKDALQILLNERARFLTTGPTQGELDRARKNITQTMNKSAAEAADQKTQSLIEEATRNFFEGEFMIGRLAEAALSEAVLAPLTPADVQRELTSFAGGNTVVTVASAQKLGVAEPDVVAMVKNAKGATVIDETVPTELLSVASLPPRGPVAKETRHEAVGAVAWTLGNGVRVIWKPTTFERDTVSLRAISPGGLATVPRRDQKAIFAALAVASDSGLGAHSGPMINKILAGRDALIDPYVERISEGFTGEAAAADLELLFQELYLAFAQPRFDADALAAWRNATTESLKTTDNNPTAKGQREFQKRLRRGHPASTPLESSEARKLTLSQLAKAYRARFGNAADFTFVFVGKGDEVRVKALAEQYLGSLPTSAKREKQKAVGDVLARPSRWQVKAGAEAKAEVMITVAAPGSWSKEADADADNLGTLLGERLLTRLREEMSGVYGVAAWIDRRREAMPTELHIRFSCDPKNIAALEAAIKAELHAIAATGFTAQELADRKTALARERELQTKSNAFWLKRLALAEFWAEPLDQAGAELPTAARATNENLQALAKQFDGQPWIVLHRIPAQTPAPAKTTN